MTLLRRLAQPRHAALLLLIVALALRVWDFGNPVIKSDEEYYLLVGDRLLHGAVPFIDIWDRKPVGLFLLFAGFRLLPGDGILAYQIAATLCAVGTAVLVGAGARMLGARNGAALLAAIVYLLGLQLLGGRGGQTPVYYNLLMAAGGVLCLRLPRLAAERRTGAIVASGALACALAGIGIQLKYTPAFEGAFFGAAHLWFLVHAGQRWPGVIGAALLWMALGLAPSAAAIAWYAAKGPDALEAFWFANVISIMLRRGYPLSQLLMRLLGIAGQSAPSLIGAIIAWRIRPRDGLSAQVSATGYAWLGAAVVGFFIIGSFFDHYALPLLAPLAMLAAPAFDRYRWLALFALLLPLAIITADRLLNPNDAAGARTVAAVVKANSVDGCPYVFVGDTITYHLAGTCIPTPYAFPNLLAYDTEQGATGVDEAAEVRRILATRPPVIVTSTRRVSIWNLGSLWAVKHALGRDYRLVFTTPRSNWVTAVYLRRDLPYRTPSSPAPTSAVGR